MKKLTFLMAFVALALLGGCSKSGGDEAEQVATKSELSIGLPIGISRTAVDAEGRASWTEGDTFALWAENATGGFIYDAVPFQMMYYWHSLQSAVFTSNANSLAEGNYTYYAVSPKPESTNALKATYTIPAEQNGVSFNGAYDIMVAAPVEAEALSADKVNNLALDFHHKMHTLKMTIAENNFPFVVSKLNFEFPSSVVGKVVVDAKNRDAAVEVSESGNTLTLSINKELNADDVLYAIVLPGSINGEVKLTAQSPQGHNSLPRVFNMSKELKEGHITPMSLVIPDILRITTIRFSIGENKLGEAVQKLTILDNNGANLGTFNVNSSNTYELTYNGVFENSGYGSFGGRTFTARFESAHAIVEQQFTMPTIAEYTTTVVPAIDVPYLFFEDFSCIHTAGESYGDDERNSAEERYQPGVNLDPYMYHTGWNAARFQLGIGTCARINVRYQAVSSWFTSTHRGRLDTPKLAGLKSGAKVNIKVEFDAGAHVDSGLSGFNGTNCSIIGVATHTNSASTINGVASGAAQSGSLGDYGSTFFTKNLDDSFGTGDFGSSFPTFSATTTNVTNATRLVFYPDTSIKASGISTGNAECFIYIDNIKVSIAQ